MTPPITRRLLTSTAVVQVPAKGSLGGVYAEPVELRRVAFERAQEVRQTGYQLADGPSGTMYVDAVATEGAFRVPVGSLVSVDGSVPVAVTRCEELRCGGQVHHWEVELG